MQDITSKIFLLIKTSKDTKNGIDILKELYINDSSRKYPTVQKGICPISTHLAGFYTTNPELFPIVEPSNTVEL